MGGIDWGTAPEWVAAVGSAGALLVAFLLLRHERIERRRVELDAKWAQARQVSFHIETTPKFEVDTDSDGAVIAHHLDRVADYVVAATLSNNSHEPIRQYTAMTIGPAGVPLNVQQRSVLQARTPIMMPTQHLPGYGAPPFQFHGWVDFTDARDVRWRRYSDGRLEEIVDPGAEASRQDTRGPDGAAVGRGAVTRPLQPWPPSSTTLAQRLMSSAKARRAPA